MASNKPRTLLRIEYEEAAEAYMRSLPPEHFMEAAAQGKQREITLESLALVKARRPDVQIFNELLVQYPLRGRSRPRQVVPDNMVVVWNEPIKVSGSFDVPLQPVGRSGCWSTSRSTTNARITKTTCRSTNES
jgi:hypothetical protein